MNIFNTLLVSSLLAFATTASAQDADFGEIINGKRYAPSLKPEEIPDGFKAVQIKSASNPMADLMNGSMGMIGAMMGGMSGAMMGKQMPQISMMQMASVVWTNGERVNLFGAKFLVTYQTELDMMSMMAMQGDVKPSFNLQLHFVKEDSITGISPRPDITKEKLLATIAMMPTQSEESEVETEAEGVTTPGTRAKKILDSLPWAW